MHSTTEQPPFWQGRSTGGLLVLVTLDNDGETHWVSHEISKALDRVWHEGLLTKLSTFGFPPLLVSWTSSFFQQADHFRPGGRDSVSADLREYRYSPGVCTRILFINNLLSGMSNPADSFVDDAPLLPPLPALLTEL